jgi:L-amino acid N-acyltransferase YncA
MQPIDPAQDLVVVPLDVDHWPEVEAIYPAGIDTGHATFEAKPPAWDDFDATVQGRGIGRLLLGALIQSTEEAGIWTIQSGIFPENTASLRVHGAAGTTPSAHASESAR